MFICKLDAYNLGDNNFVAIFFSFKWTQVVLTAQYFYLEKFDLLVVSAWSSSPVLVDDTE